MDTDLTAELAEIKARYRHCGNSSDIHVNLESYIDSANDIPRLLAAVEAVLELAGEAQQVDTGGTWIPCWDLDPAEVREAISREITGKEGER